MTSQPLTERAILFATGTARVELRGPSGRLYGYLDLQALTLEVKRKNEAPETIDLAAHLRAAGVLRDEPPPIISPL